MENFHKIEKQIKILKNFETPGATAFSSPNLACMPQLA